MTDVYAILVEMSADVVVYTRSVQGHSVFIPPDGQVLLSAGAVDHDVLLLALEAHVEGWAEAV